MVSPPARRVALTRNAYQVTPRVGSEAHLHGVAEPAQDVAGHLAAHLVEGLVDPAEHDRAAGLGDGGTGPEDAHRGGQRADPHERSRRVARETSPARSGSAEVGALGCEEAATYKAPQAP
jgi:hypothetical protein